MPCRTCYLMSLVSFITPITTSKIFSLKCLRVWSWSLEYVMVNWKYANRKPICDLIFHNNSNFYPICHCLRVNRLGTFEILSIRISDPKIERQCYEKRRGVLRYYTYSCLAYNFLKKRVFNPLSVSSQSNRIFIHYISFAMLKIGNFHLILKIFIKVTDFGMPK